MNNNFKTSLVIAPNLRALLWRIAKIGMWLTPRIISERAPNSSFSKNHGDHENDENNENHPDNKNKPRKQIHVQSQQ